jgi:hypothetical protein
LVSLLTRVHIRVPFEGEIISHETRFSDTIDNVKVKIDNVKSKDSVRGGPRTPIKTLTGKTPSLRPDGSISDSSLLEGPPPRSLRLARQLSASHEKSPSRASSSRLRLRRGSRHAARPRDTNVFTTTRGEPIHHAMQAHQLAAGVRSWPRQKP